MTKQQVTYIVLIAFFVGAAGSIIFGRFLIPYVATFHGFSALNKLVTSSPIVINRREEVQLNEGVNLIDLIKKSGNFTVRISDAKNNFVGNGVIATSDGLIMTTDAIGGTSPITVTLNDGNALPAEVKFIDAKNHLSLLKIAATGLPVIQFEDAASLEPGHRVIYIGRSNVKFQHLATAGLVSQSLANQPENKQVSSDAVVTADYSGGPIVNLNGNVVGLVLNGSQNIISETLRTELSAYLSQQK